MYNSKAIWLNIKIVKIVKILTGSWSLSYFDWIIEFNEFWADLGVYIIKLHFNGYSCHKRTVSRI
jgi:hypothetical protein